MPNLFIALTNDGRYCLVVDGVRGEVYDTAAEAIKAREKLERPQSQDRGTKRGS